jgi:beta-galactosidase
VWVEAGHEVAREQILLRRRPPVINPSADKTPEVSSSQTALTVEGEGFKATFDKSTGVLSSLVYGMTEMISNGEGPAFNWYRSINNDKYTDQSYYETTSENLMMTHRVDSTNGSVVVLTDMEARINNDRGITVPVTVKYTVYGNGAIQIDATFTKPARSAIIHRLGLRMTLPEGFENVEWYGRGPHENYSDRATSAFVGRYTTTVTGMEEEHYVRAQSMGNREDVRWMTLTDDAGKGVRIVSKDRLNFSALHFTDRDAWYARHDFALDEVRKPEVYLNLDCIQEGLGNASCGPMPLPQYMVPENEPQSYSFIIEPIK